MQDADYFLELQTNTGWGSALARFAEWIAPQAGWLTLDIGCGPGLLPALFAQLRCQAVGVDIDSQMFSPESLHDDVAVADTLLLPFPEKKFDLVTASNILFLLPNPQHALQEMGRVLHRQGQMVVLNPSENLNVQRAASFASARNLNGLARDSLLNWAARAESNFRWSEEDLHTLFDSVGMCLVETITAVGPGFARFARASWK